MNTFFESLFSSEPTRKENGIYFFNSDIDGDCFEASDKEVWLVVREWD